MATLVYVDETGASGTKDAKKQPLLTCAAVLVEEEKVQPLAKAMEEVAWAHLGWLPADLEFHGYEIWSRTGYWKDKSYDGLIAVYERLIDIVPTLDLDLACSSIHKERLHARYDGAADHNAYPLALQFLLEKVDRVNSTRKIVVADEAKEHEFKVTRMMKGMQRHFGGGEVPGEALRNVIDTLHFVRSHDSLGVQLADLVAFVIQRHAGGFDTHDNARGAIRRLHDVVWERMVTWREPWPAK